MKYTITHTAEWILLTIITVLLIFTAYKSYQLKGKVETITVTDTLTIQDTITNWEPYDVHHYRTDTAYLPVIDTILDTVTDSVFVEVPISLYRYDTTIVDSNYETSLKAVVSGFGVTMDSLYLNTKIMPLKAKKQPWYGNIVPAVGVGFGTGGFGVFAGLGYKLF